MAVATRSLQREPGAGPGIRTDIDLISPTYAIYSHPFAFKVGLGFDKDKQHEMLASGCRRARLALEWRRYSEGVRAAAAPAKSPTETEHVEEFRGKIKEAVADQKAWWEHLFDGKARNCIFGEFTPEHRAHFASGNKDATHDRCPFVEGDMSAVFERCKATSDTELNVPDLKLHLPVIHR